MARTLDPQIMSDPWFIELDDRARLGWMMLILNGTDDQGRFLMNGRLMKSMLFPADDLPAAEVLSMLEGFARAGKIQSYEQNGVCYGQIVKWWKFQIGSEWMAPSRHPAPEGWIDRWRIHAKGGKGVIETSPEWSDKKLCGFGAWAGRPAQAGEVLPDLPLPNEAGSGLDNDLDSGSGNDLGSCSGSGLGRPSGTSLPEGLPSGEVKVKGEDKGEGEVGKMNQAPPAAFSKKTFSLYQENIGPLTSAVSERISLAENDCPPGWVQAAICLAARRNKRRWDYIEGILRSWQRDGRDDGEQAPRSYADELLAAGYTLPEQVPAGWLT